ncbi:TPA: NADP-dependent oxidoreductase [Pseudomonas aeruginosa]|nr:NADP-dependent oxidoreductase [Pseudomonas aeruginosa]
MSQSTQVNRRIVLASRPHGAPTRDNFRIEQVPLPEPGAGQVLLRTVYLSLDPYMRGRMSDAPSYAPPVELGAVMVGATVGQIGKLKGCRVVGVAGGAEKCRHAVQVLGFDACLDHHAADFAERLAEACPDGIDIYYENVGGKVFDAVFPLLNAKARIPVCGIVAHYNDTELPPGPDRLPALMGTILRKRIKVQGFIIFDDYGHRYDEFQRDMSKWFADGLIQYREERVDGLENAPEAFFGLLQGRNFGKLVVRVGADA